MLATLDGEMGMGTGGQTVG